MRTPLFLLVAWVCIAAAALVAAPFSIAADGHDHGEAPAATGTASPRLSTHSDLFELVGIVDKGRMTVYLDRYATNEPVTGAKIEFESGSSKGVAVPQADGTYLVKFDALGKPGELPFSFTVTAGADTDLLAADLDLKDPHDDAAEVGRPWTRYLAYAAAAAVALALALGVSRKWRAARRARVIS